MAESVGSIVYLVYGKNGWIGGQIINLLRSQGKTVHAGDARLENRDQVARELDELRPTHVINAAGVTGRPNVDWCEDHKAETIRANVLGTLNLADLTSSRNIHCTIFATGCIFQYDDAHPMRSGVGFVETDTGNFSGSFYSKSKGMVEELLKCFSDTLILRLRMPISDDLNPRSFITKIIQYERVVNIPNSMSVLFDLLPVSLALSLKRVCGVVNFTNPGAISHNEILDLYKEMIDNDFVYVNFSLEEQDKILKAKRSNNELDSSYLQSLVPEIHIPHIQDSIRGVFRRMRVNLEHEGIYPDHLPRKHK